MIATHHDELDENITIVSEKAIDMQMMMMLVEPFPHTMQLINNAKK